MQRGSQEQRKDLDPVVESQGGLEAIVTQKWNCCDGEGGEQRPPCKQGKEAQGKQGHAKAGHRGCGGEMAHPPRGMDEQSADDPGRRRG